MTDDRQQTTLWLMVSMQQEMGVAVARLWIRKEIASFLARKLMRQERIVVGYREIEMAMKANNEYNVAENWIFSLVPAKKWMLHSHHKS